MPQLSSIIARIHLNVHVHFVQEQTHVAKVVCTRKVCQKHNLTVTLLVEITRRHRC